MTDERLGARLAVAASRRSAKETDTVPDKCKWLGTQSGEAVLLCFGLGLYYWRRFRHGYEWCVPHG